MGALIAWPFGTLSYGHGELDTARHSSHQDITYIIALVPVLTLPFQELVQEYENNFYPAVTDLPSFFISPNLREPRGSDISNRLNLKLLSQR